MLSQNCQSCIFREIKNYKEFCEIVKPDAVNIDYNVNPKEIVQNIKIPVQGGLDPKILLTDEETLKKETTKYLEIFKDHPYIYNLGPQCCRNQTRDGRIVS